MVGASAFRRLRPCWSPDAAGTYFQAALQPTFDVIHRMSPVGLRNLSLRTKLVLALLAVGVLAVAVTGGESYRRARRALEADAVNQLTAVREERRRAVEAHFARLRLETTTLAETSLVGEAMRRFAAAWDDLERQAQRVPSAQIAAWRARVAARQRALSGLASA